VSVSAPLPQVQFDDPVQTSPVPQFPGQAIDWPQLLVTVPHLLLHVVATESGVQHVLLPVLQTLPDAQQLDPQSGDAQPQRLLVHVSFVTEQVDPQFDMRPSVPVTVPQLPPF
jgi:hypothetical protein